MSQPAAASHAEWLWTQALLDALPLPLVLVDATDGAILRLNAAALQLGGDPEEIAVALRDGGGAHFLTDERDQRLAPAQLPIPRILAGERGPFEGVWHTRAGRVIVLARAAELPAMHGHGPALVLMVQDVSDLKRATAALTAAVRARDDFLAVASHELNTPLTSLRLQAQMALRRLRAGGMLSPERVGRLVQETDLSVERLARLVRDMLDISRLSRGALPLSRAQVDLAALARDVVERFLPAAAERGCRLSLQATPAVGIWDRFRLEQVLGNLLTNALRYGDGQPIVVHVGVVADCAVLRVTDAGPGVPVADRERVFERFERAISASEVSGLGLGLYICRELVQGHQGTLTLESPAEGGASFVVRLPLGAPTLG